MSIYLYISSSFLSSLLSIFLSLTFIFYPFVVPVIVVVEAWTTNHHYHYHYHSYHHHRHCQLNRLSLQPPITRLEMMMNPSKDDITSTNNDTNTKTTTDRTDTDNASLPTTTTTTITKKLLCIRHGISLANEYMNQKGNQWGDETFQDDVSLIDTPLSKVGKEYVEEYLPKQLSSSSSSSSSTSSSLIIEFMDNVELVVISPLTRCLQTYCYGIKDIIQQKQEEKMRNEKETKTTTAAAAAAAAGSIPILAVPLLRERVYTISDTGRTVNELQKEFHNDTEIDFSQCATIGAGQTLQLALSSVKKKEEEEEEQQQQEKSSLISSTGTATSNINNKNNNNTNTNNENQDDDGANENTIWWYNEPPYPKQDVEWRPHGQGQWYGTPGEPEHVFDQRMGELNVWLSKRNETNILVVGHWGVFYHMTKNGIEWKNAEAKLIQWTFNPMDGTCTTMLLEE